MRIVVAVRSRVVALVSLVLCLASGLGPAAAVPLAAVQSTPSPSAASTTWALQPATADGPDGRVSLRHVLAGGGEASDLVALTNFSDGPATFAVYASDGVIAADGSFDVLASDDPPVGGGAWITISPVEGSSARDGGGIVLEVPADSTVLVPVQVRVPENATPGDHPAGIVAELVRAGGGAVQITSRVGVRVHLRVDGDVVAKVVPESVTASYLPSWNPFSSGTVRVRLAVTNAGNVRLGAETVASIAGPFGIAPAQARTERREVLPGQAATTTLDIPVTPLFFARGDVEVTPVVVGEDEVDSALMAAHAAFTVWAVPWSQLALLALAVGLFFLVRRLRRRNAARVQARIDAAVAAATSAAAGGEPDAARAEAEASEAGDT